MTLLLLIERVCDSARAAWRRNRQAVFRHIERNIVHVTATPELLGWYVDDGAVARRRQPNRTT